LPLGFHPVKLPPHQPFMLVIVACVCCAMTGVAQTSSPPASPQQGHTAAELLNAGQAAYNGGQWKEAIDAFSKFLADYGSVETLAEAVRRVRPLLAFSHLRLEEYQTAVPLMEGALKDPRLELATRAALQYSLGIACLKTSQFDQARRALGVVFNDAKANAA